MFVYLILKSRQFQAKQGAKMRLSIFLTALKLLKNQAVSGRNRCKYENVSDPELFQNQAVSGKNRCKYETVSRFLFSSKSQAVSGRNYIKNSNCFLNFRNFQAKISAYGFFFTFSKKVKVFVTLQPLTKEKERWKQELQ